MNSAAFVSSTGLGLLRICLAYLQICRNSTVRVSLAKKITVIHSVLFILFISLVYFFTCYILLLARDDTWMQKIPGPAFFWWRFPCDTDSNLCDTGVLRWWHFMWNTEFFGLWGPLLMHFSFSSPWWSTSGCAAWAYIFTEHQSHLEGKYSHIHGQDKFCQYLGAFRALFYLGETLQVPLPTDLKIFGTEESIVQRKPSIGE